jgi:hypothetical protein
MSGCCLYWYSPQNRHFVRGVKVSVYARHVLMHIMKGYWWSFLVDFGPGQRKAWYLQYNIVVRGHPSIPLLPLFLTMSICIPHSLCTYLTTSIPLQPSCDNQCPSSISRHSMIPPTSSQPRSMPHNYHRPHQGSVTWPYSTLQWSLDFHICKAWICTILNYSPVMRHGGSLVWWNLGGVTVMKATWWKVWKCHKNCQMCSKSAQRACEL